MTNKYLIQIYVGMEYFDKYEKIKKILIEKEHPEARPFVKIGPKILQAAVKKEIDNILEGLEAEVVTEQIFEAVEAEISDNEIINDKPFYPPIKNNSRF